MGVGRAPPNAYLLLGGDSGFAVGGVALLYIGVALVLAFWGLAARRFVFAAVANLSELIQLGNEVLKGFTVAFAQAALFLAGNELLRASGRPKASTVVNEILGVATIVVWGVLLVGTVLAMDTGQLVSDE